VRGWLAIDPKGLTGDPACDYAIMLFWAGAPDAVALPDLVAARIAPVAALAGLTSPRLAGWGLCVAAQYAGWFHGTPMGEAMMAVAERLSLDGALAEI
jgi:streptomycin 6-kinase